MWSKMLKTKNRLTRFFVICVTVGAGEAMRTGGARHQACETGNLLSSVIPSPPEAGGIRSCAGWRKLQILPLRSSRQASTPLRLRMTNQKKRMGLYALEGVLHPLS